jgi:MipA family protein
MKAIKRLLRRAAHVLLLAGLSSAACASDPLINVLRHEGGAGLGLGWRLEQSPYKGGATRFDFMPLYLYESDVLYLHAYRFGLKFDDQPTRRFDVFLEHRFEGFPYDRIPDSLTGMEGRDPGVDIGIGYEERLGAGFVFADLRHDAARVSKGSEARLGYRLDIKAPRWTLRPHVAFFLRDSKLNNYYYGVLPSEARADRPAYAPGAGVNSQVGINAVYELTQRWRVLAGVAATRWSSEVRNSPITALNIAQFSGFLGAAYDFSPEKTLWDERSPLLVRAFYGRSTPCNLIATMRLTCTSIDRDERTDVVSAEVGRVFLERANGWNLDFNGYIGVLRHDERGLAPDSWQVNAYMKALWYGFPWRDRVRTRVGFGAGLSFASHIPYVEGRDQARRQRNTSKLLNYLDPSVDVNVGDLLRTRSLRDTWFGVGVSHRSGIFGNSQVFGNVNGGSNYIYTFLETKI